jgi:DNA mismatch repair protein MutS
MTSIYGKYLNYVHKYKKIYGEKCIVLMEVGAFYEIYDDGSGLVDIHTLAEICNLNVSQKNKKNGEVSIESPYMAGFHTNYALKYQTSLLNENYTCVIVSQTNLETINGKEKYNHEVTSILSTATIMTTNKYSNYLAVLYFEQYLEKLVVGIACIDISTGHTYIHEALSTNDDPDLSRDEIYRILSILCPTELLIVSSKKHPISDKNKRYIIANITDICSMYHYKWEDYEELHLVEKIYYQSDVFQKAYKNTTMLSIIEFLNLSNLNLARVALCVGLMFAYEHNVDIIKDLDYPIIFNEFKHLNIQYNSILQLNMISLIKNENSVLKILNKCKTAFGSRAFTEQLMNPILDIEKLNYKYDRIEFFKDKDIGSYLTNINDLERIKRKLLFGKYMPNEWSSLIKSFENIKKIFENIGNDIDDINTLLEYTSKLILNTYFEANENIFKVGIFPEIDALIKLKNEDIDKIDKIALNINGLSLDNDNTLCKVEKTEKEGYFIIMTKKRYENALKLNNKYMDTFIKHTISQSNSNYKLTNKDISKHSNNIANICLDINKTILKEYKLFVTDFDIHLFTKLINIVTEIDLSFCSSQLALNNNLSRPLLLKDDDKSYVQFKGIRHPIIELVNHDIEFVKNDVEINEKGILLYGINASGKSSLMKAIGINVILAQCGMYVYSDKMTLVPYNHIFTRISGMDNIYKNMSSFTIEMTELRNILKRSTSKSLVLGDEICCGTESISGSAIVASSIKMLIDKKVGFIFATHLHELIELQIIKQLSNKLNICHMSITIQNDIIIYDRKLKEGSGSRVYGIEVCKALDMPSDFLQQAENVRKDIMNINKLMINDKKSRYNSNIYLDMCDVCKINKAIETHHIKYQKNADKNNFIDSYHKNSKHNLVAICEECHNKEHTGKIKILGYKDTSTGIILDVIY